MLEDNMSKKEGYLYVGFDATKLFKIGITNNYEKRLRQFRTGNPTFHYIMVFNVESPAVAEIEMHTKFDYLKYSGEWFKLNASDLKWIYDRFTTEHRHTYSDFETVLQKIQDGIALDLNLRIFMRDYYIVDGGDQ